MSLTLVTAPSVEPISLDEAKLHLKLDTSPTSDHPDDNLVTALIKAARKLGEDFQNRAYVTQTWTLYLNGFPSGRMIEIPLPPLQSIVSMIYKDENDTLQTVSFIDTSGSPVFETDDYIVDLASEPGRICLKDGSTWPGTSRNAQAVQIQFVAGYGLAADVPETIRAAIYLKISDLYENRGDEKKGNEGAWKALLWPDRILSL